MLLLLFSQGGADAYSVCAIYLFLSIRFFFIHKLALSLMGYYIENGFYFIWFSITLKLEACQLHCIVMVKKPFTFNSQCHYLFG